SRLGCLAPQHHFVDLHPWSFQSRHSILDPLEIAGLREWRPIQNFRNELEEKMPPSPCGDLQKREGGWEVAGRSRIEDGESRIDCRFGGLGCSHFDPQSSFLDLRSQSPEASAAPDSEQPRGSPPQGPIRLAADDEPAGAFVSSTPRSAAIAGLRPPRCGPTSLLALSKSNSCLPLESASPLPR